MGPLQDIVEALEPLEGHTASLMFDGHMLSDLSKSLASITVIDSISASTQVDFTLSWRRGFEAGDHVFVVNDFVATYLHDPVCLYSGFHGKIVKIHRGTNRTQSVTVNQKNGGDALIYFASVGNVWISKQELDNLGLS